MPIANPTKTPLTPAQRAEAAFQSSVAYIIEIYKAGELNTDDDIREHLVLSGLKVPGYRELRGDSHAVFRKALPYDMCERISSVSNDILIDILSAY